MITQSVRRRLSTDKQEMLDTGIPYDRWNAKQINMEFARLSKTSKPGNVLPATVTHGFNKLCDKLALVQELSFTKK